jgi:hypothetical protein
MTGVSNRSTLEPGGKDDSASVRDSQVQGVTLSPMEIEPPNGRPAHHRAALPRREESTRIQFALNLLFSLSSL